MRKIYSAIYSLTTGMNTKKSISEKWIKLFFILVALAFGQQSFAQTNTWDGSSGPDWNTKANWSLNSIPTATTDVIIPNTTRKPVIGNLDGICRSITINSSSSLTITSSNTLDVYGDWTNNGTFTPNNGTVTFKSATNNTIGGTLPTTFYNLIINKSATANTVTSITKAFTVANDLTVTQGNLVLQADDNDYTFSNNVTVTTNGILTHSVPWDPNNHKIGIGGNLNVTGIFNPTVRSHVQLNGSGAHTLQTGNNPASTLSILTLNNGIFTASGTLKTNQEAWVMFGLAGSFTTNGNDVTFSSLVNNQGVINVNTGGTLTVNGSTEIGYGGSVGTMNVSAGTVNLNGDLSIDASGKVACTNSPQINISGNWTNNGAFTSAGSTVTFNNTSAAQTISGSAATQNFNNIVISKSSQSLIASGTAGNNINVTGNWTNTSGAFVPGSGKVTFGGSSTQQISGPAVTTFNNVTLSIINGAGLTLNGVDANITGGTGALTFTAGKITTGTNTLILDNNATTSGASANRYVYGNLQMGIVNGATTRTFDIGDASRYTPVSLALAGVTNSTGSITAFTVGSQHPNIGSASIDDNQEVNRYYSLSNTGVTLASYNPTFTYLSTDVDAGATTANFIVGLYNGGWTYPTVGTKTTTTTQATGVNTFGTFAIGQAASVPTMNAQPTGQSVCPNVPTTFTAKANNIPNSTVIWQISTNGGTLFSTLTTGSPYSVNTSSTGGITTTVLTINPATTGLNNYQYRAKFTNTKGSVTSDPATLTVIPLPVITPAASAAAVCLSTSLQATTLSYTATNAPTTYSISWNASPSNSFATVTDATLASPTSGNITITVPANTPSGTYTGNITVKNGNNCSSSSSKSFTLTVIPLPVITPAASAAAVCLSTSLQATTLSYTATNAPTTYSISWNASPSNSFATVTDATLASPTSGNITITVPANTAAGTYTGNITVKNGNNCSSSSSKSFTLTVIPLPVITPAASAAAVCLSTSLQATTLSYTATNAPTTYSISWNASPSNSFATVTDATLASPTSGNITITVPANTAAGTYTGNITVKNGNNCSSSSSTDFTVTVNPLPVITTPNTAEICSGSTTNISLVASVSSSFSWTASSPDGITGFSTPVSNVSTISDVLTNHDANNAGTVIYSVTPTSTTGSCVGPAYPITVTVDAPVVITTDLPATTPACATQLVTFTVAATGTGLTYKWYKGGVLIDGSYPNTTVSGYNTNTLKFAQVQTSDDGEYYVEVIGTGSCGSVESAHSILSVDEKIVIDPTTPTSTVVCTGGTATFSVTATGTDLHYQWYKGSTALDGDGGRITGFNSSTLTINNVTTADVANNYYVQITNTGGGCNLANSKNISLTLKPIPTITSVNNPSPVCSGVTYAISFTKPVTGTTISWTSDPTGVTGTSTGTNQDVTSIPVAWVNTGSTLGTVVYHIIPSANGCIGATTDVTINVNPEVKIIDPTPSTQTICSGTSTDIALSGNITGATFHWEVDQANASGATSGDGNSIAQILKTTGAVTGTVVYHVTPKANGCEGASFDVTVTVNPTPAIISITGPSNICNGTSATLVLAVSGTGTISGVLSDGTPFSGTAPSISVSVTSAAQTTYTIATLTNGTCSAQAADLTPTILVSVNPSPTGKITGTTSICSGGAATLNIAVTGTGTISGALSDGNTFSGVAPDISVNVSPTTNTTYTITSLSDANSCSAISTDLTGTATVTVKPKPVAIGTNMTQTGICSGSPIAPINFSTSPNVPGTVFNWTRDHSEITGITSPNSGNISGSLTNPNPNPVTVTFTVTPVADGCPGDAIYPKVTVNPVPVLSSPLNAPGRCNNQSYTYTPTSNTTGATFTWTRDAVAGITNAAVTTSQIGAATEKLINDNITNSTINVVYKYTLSINGCTNTQNVTVPVYSNLRSVNLSDNQILCAFVSSPAPLTATIVGGNPSDYVYKWEMKSQIYVPFVGYVTYQDWTNVTGTNTNTLTPRTPPTLPLIQDEYRLTISNNCGESITSTIRTISIGADIGLINSDNSPVTICSEMTFTKTISIVNSVGQHFDGYIDYSWQQSTDPGTITANTPAAPATYPTGTPVSPFIGTAIFTGINPTNAIINKTLTITPTAHNNSPFSTCALSSSVIPVTINPVPKISDISKTVCSGTPFDATPVNDASNIVPANTTYTWTVGTNSVGATSQSVGQPNISQTLTYSTIGTSSVVYTVTPTYNGQCAGSTFKLTVNVNPTPSIDPVADQPVCNGSPTTAINFNLTPSGSDFSWTNDQPSIGLPASGTTNIASFTAVNNSTLGLPITANLSVIPSSTINGVTCSAAVPITFKIIVNPTPKLTTPANQTVCNGSSTAQVNFISSTLNANTYYSWTNDQPSIGLAASGSTDPVGGNNIPLFVATNSGSTAITATITVTPHYGSLSGCGGAAKTFTIIVNPTLIAGTISGSAFICKGSSVQFTTLGGSSGGSWSSSVASVATVSSAGIVTGVANGVTKITYSTNGCNGLSTNSFDVSVTISGQWLGTNSNDWNDATNWGCGGIPDLSTNVIIPSGTPHNPVILNAAAMAKNITIASGATLKVTGQTLQVFGAMTAADLGSVDAGNGTIEFKGSTTAQSISGKIFKDKIIQNLKISNPSGLNLSANLNDTLNITGVVTFGVNNSTLNTNDNLTLKSTAAATASIGAIPEDGSGNLLDHIIGKVEVERFINIANGTDSHGKSWQFLATPTNEQTLFQSWMENGNKTITGYGALFTGPAGKGFDNTTTANSVKYWDERVNDWTGIASANAPLYNSRGYLTFIRGDRSVSGLGNNTTPTNTTLRSKGVLTMGLQTFTVPKSTLNHFYSIGNPYASPVDLTSLQISSTPEESIIYLWDPSLAGSLNLHGVGGWLTGVRSGNDYLFVPGGVNIDNLESGQAFLVQTEDNARNITIDESNKATGSSNTLFREQTSKVPTLSTTLFSVDQNGKDLINDGTLQQFDKNYSNKVDGKDARKIMNASNNFAIKTGGVNLIVERHAPLTEQDTIQYYMANMAAQSYRLEFKAQQLSSEGVDGFVEDTYLNTRTPLNMEGTTDVDFTVTSDKGSSATGRFRIVFKTTVVLPVKFVSVTAAQKDANIEVDWKVENEHTVKQYDVEKSIDGVNFKEAYNVAAGNNGDGSYQWLDVQATPGYNYYRIRMEDQTGQVSYSSVVKVLIPFGKPSIGIYPNPITDGIVHLQLVNQPKGKYGIRLLNPLGQTIAAKQIEHAGGNATENLKWDYTLAHGIYELQVLKPDGNIQVIKVMY